MGYYLLATDLVFGLHPHHPGSEQYAIRTLQCGTPPSGPCAVLQPLAACSVLQPAFLGTAAAGSVRPAGAAQRSAVHQLLLLRAALRAVRKGWRRAAAGGGGCRVRLAARSDVLLSNAAGQSGTRGGRGWFLEHTHTHTQWVKHAHTSPTHTTRQRPLHPQAQALSSTGQCLAAPTPPPTPPPMPAPTHQCTFPALSSTSRLCTPTTLRPG